MNWEKASDEKKLQKLNEMFEASEGQTKKRHFEWYLNRMFLDGNHYSYYNTTTNTIEQKPRKEGEVRLVVNKVRSSIRAIQNFVTRERPKWYTKPSDLDEGTVKNAHRSGKLLDYIYRHLHMEAIIEGMVDQALNTSVAWVEIDWDEDDGDQGQVRVRLHDSFDIFPDVNGGVYKGMFTGKYLFKAITKSVEAVKNDERYDKNRKKVVNDDKLAASKLKERYIRKKRGKDDKEEKITVKEAQIKDGDTTRLITFGGGQILREEETDNGEFTLYPMQVPLDPLNIFHRSWVADAIPLNKAIDRAVSQKIMYVNQALIFRLIAEKGHGINRFTNNMGEFLEINKNRTFKQMAMQPLPSAVDNLTNELSMYLEDILGAHDAALGRLPTGARSGKTLEALQAADSNNLAGLTKGLKTMLSVMGRRILEIAADKYSTTRVIDITDPEQGEKYIKVIGEGAPDDLKEEDAAVISSDIEVQVEIGSWLGYTKTEQRETLMSMAELGIIPADEILRQMEFPNVDELSNKAREERLEQHKLDAEIAGRKGEGGQPQGQGGDEMIQLADEENTMMLNGEALPPTQGATMQHTQGHIDLTQTRVYQEATQDPAVADAFEQHIQGELQAQGMA